MIRFLLDMGIAQSTSRSLSSPGHDTIHLRDQGLERLQDRMIVEKAQREGRVIVTHDLDFGRIVALSEGSVRSIITLRLSDMTPGRVNQSPGTVVGQASSALERGALITVTDRGFRIRELPIDAD